MKRTPWRSPCIRVVYSRRLSTARPPTYSFRSLVVPRVTTRPRALHTSVTHKIQGKNPIVIGKDSGILLEAQQYGITTLAELELESSLGSTSDIGTKLTDRFPTRQDLRLWKLVLDYQKYRNGANGVRVIWHGMKRRGMPVLLPEGDDDSEAIWNALLLVALADTEFLRELCIAAISGQIVRKELFVEVIGALLASKNASKASDFAQRLKTQALRSNVHSRQFSRPGAPRMMRILEAASRSEDPDAIKHFEEVSARFPDIHMYDEAIPYLCGLDRFDDAHRLHMSLIRRNDLPSSVVPLERFVRKFATNGKGLEPFLRSLETAGVSFTAQCRRIYSRERSRLVGLSQENLNIVASYTLGMPPNKLRDEFVARAIATNAFSFDFTVRSLQLVGLAEIGPLSMRQILLSSEDLETLRSKLVQLEKLDIDLGASTYVRIVQRLAATGHFQLLQLVAETDQHHDNFDDDHLQRTLLARFYQKKEWDNVNLALTILNNGDTSNKAQERAANLMLRAALICRDFKGILGILDQMQEKGHKVSQARVKHFLSSLLPFDPATQPDYDNVIFLIAIWQRICISGTHIPLTLWKTPLRRLAMLRRFNELENATVWVANWYRENGLNADFLDHPLHGDDTNLDTVFTEGFQTALIGVAFRSTSEIQPPSLKRVGSQSTKPQLWLRGVHLIRRLRDDFRVTAKTSTIRRAFVARLRQFFSEEGYSKLTRNRRARAQNRTLLHDYLRSFELAWSGKADPDIVTEMTSQTLKPQKYRKCDIASHPDLSNRLRSNKMAAVSTTSLPTELNKSDFAYADDKVEQRLVSQSQPVDVKHENSSSQIWDDNVEEEPPQGEDASDAVVYHDFFHPSPAEYEGTKQNRKNKA